MALTSTEQNKIMQLLGWAGKALASGSDVYSKILADRMTSLPTDTESLVRAYLTQVAAIETQMNAAPTRLIAKKVGDIELNNRELSDLRIERKRIAKEIAVHLNIPNLAGSGGISVVV